MNMSRRKEGRSRWIVMGGSGQSVRTTVAASAGLGGGRGHRRLREGGGRRPARGGPAAGYHEPSSNAPLHSGPRTAGQDRSNLSVLKSIEGMSISAL